MTNPTDHLLRYRPWKGELNPPAYASVAMARSSLRLLFRRKIFWALYALALMIFFFFFYGQYLVVWIQLQTANQTVTFGAMPVRVGELTKFLDKLNLNGSPHTFGNFIWFEGYITMIVLALAGAVLVGNDFQHGSLPFYLSKPIGRRHYVLGKMLGIGAFINLLTTIPALLLFIQAGLLYDWQSYYTDNFLLLLGILAYGLLLTVVLSLLLVATAVWVRRTVPLIMIWSGLFVLCRTVAGFLVEAQNFSPLWRLIDLWNDLYLIGLWLMRADIDPAKLGQNPQPWQAALVVGGLCAICLLYLRKRIQAIEIVS
jgi:ABC-2 type transport system permease protein